MKRHLPVSLLLAVLLSGVCAAAPEAQGFGAGSEGGRGGSILEVTRRDDDPLHPARGSLRWALRQKGPRMVRFTVSGDIWLRDRIIVREPFLTIDGSTAPEPGVCLRGGSLEFKDTHDIIVRRVRIRLGDETVLRKNREAGVKRPRNSGGLDCVSLDNSRRILFDHCSLSWSCDEIFGIVHCRDVTIQWCLLSEPLSNPRLHPYGDDHAFCINASASTLSIHHCLMHRFVMRGPQFECNDMHREDHYTVRMEAVNNVISGYTRSGSRYSLGVEKGNGTGEGKRFEFQILNNLYLPAARNTPPIEPILKHGTEAHVSLALRGNGVLEAASGRRSYPRLHPLSHKGPMLPTQVKPPSGGNLADRISEVVPVRSTGRTLFRAPVPVVATPVPDMWNQVLVEAGDSGREDRIDRRVRRNVFSLRFGKPLHSP